MRKQLAHPQQLRAQFLIAMVATPMNAQHVAAYSVDIHSKHGIFPMAEQGERGRRPNTPRWKSRTRDLYEQPLTHGEIRTG